MGAPQQRVATTMCARCRKGFSVGDRVATAFIVTKVGRNMETQEFGAYLAQDFELVHVSCADPGLDGKIIT